MATKTKPRIPPHANRAASRSYESGLQRHAQLDLLVVAQDDPLQRIEREFLTLPIFVAGQSGGNRRSEVNYVVTEQDGTFWEAEAPADLGLPTVSDERVICFLSSILNEEYQRTELEPSPVVEFHPTQYHRFVSGPDAARPAQSFYEALQRTMMVLRNTSIVTNSPCSVMTSDGTLQAGVLEHSWSLLSEVKTVKDARERVIAYQVILPTWLYNRIVYDRSILAISPAYHRLTAPERFLYRLGRKHGQAGRTWLLHDRDMLKLWPGSLGATPFPRIDRRMSLDEKAAAAKEALRQRNEDIDRNAPWCRQAKLALKKACANGGDIPEYLFRFEERGKRNDRRYHIAVTEREDTAMMRALPRKDRRRREWAWKRPSERKPLA